MRASKQAIMPCIMLPRAHNLDGQRVERSLLRYHVSSSQLIFAARFIADIAGISRLVTAVFLGVHGVFGEWLQMLPAAKRGEPPDVGSFMHRNVATVAFAEHFPLRMVGRGLRRFAMVSPSGPINHCEMEGYRRRAPRDRATQGCRSCERRWQGLERGLDG